MTATASDGISFQNISANSATFNLRGGVYAMITSAGTITSGSVDLQMLGPDAATFASIGLKVTTINTGITGYAPAGQYKFVLTGATGVSVGVQRVSL